MTAQILPSATCRHRHRRKLTRGRRPHGAIRRPSDSTAVGVPAHIVYRSGYRFLIADPHDIKDQLSDSLIALDARVEELEKQLGGPAQPDEPFAAEDAERTTYRVKLEHMRQYVSRGEGI